jgi:hypothetical protein
MTDARLRIREALAPALPLPCRSCLDAGITNVTLDADAEEQE